MKTLLLLLVLAFASPLYSQTKWIEHRSHSGLDRSFDLDSPSNFGICDWSAYVLPDTAIAIDTAAWNDLPAVADPVDVLQPDTTTTLQKNATGPTANGPLIETVESLDTLRPVEEAVPDSLPAGALPAISGIDTAEASISSAQADAGSGGSMPSNSLAWLALFLGIPAVSIAAVGVKRGADRHSC